MSLTCCLYFLAFAVLIGSINTESTNCKDVACPELKKIECPADSNSHTVYPSHMIDTFAPEYKYINGTDSNEEQQDNNNINNNNSDDDATKFRKILQKRSILHQRREPIKIVPGGHYDIHKRSVDKYDFYLENNTSINTSDMQARCCPYKECRCKECAELHCSHPQRPTLKRNSTRVPGDCCDEFECTLPTYCESVTGTMYNVGEEWVEQDCQTCRCENGEKKCQMYFCKPLSCSKKVRLVNECCEKCDESETDFCAGAANCNIHCPSGGFEKSIDGCNLCKCEALASTTLPVVVSTAAAAAATTTTDTATGDNNTVTSTNIQPSACDDKLNQVIKICAIVVSILVAIIVLVGFYILRHNRKNCRSYRTVPSSIESNLNKIQTYKECN